MFALWLVAVFGLSATFVLQSSFDLSSKDLLGVLSTLTAGGMVLIFTALGLWRPRPWGYIALIMFISFVVTVDAYSLWSSDGQISVYYFLDLLLISSGLYILLSKKFRMIFFDASMRWWERARRYALSESVWTGNAKAKVINISETGCLLLSYR